MLASRDLLHSSRGARLEWTGYCSVTCAKSTAASAATLASARPSAGSPRSRLAGMPIPISMPSDCNAQAQVCNARPGLAVLQARRELAQHTVGQHQAVAHGFVLARATRQAAVGAEAIERLFARDQQTYLGGIERCVLQQVQSGGFCAGFAAHRAKWKIASARRQS